MKSKGRKGKGRRRGRSSNMVSGGPDTARVTETYELTVTNINQPEEYFFEGIPVGTRAANVAPNFGLYRIAKVTYTYKPLYDTYIPANDPAPGGNWITTVPNLYWKMNRYGDAPVAFDADFLRTQGSKAIRLDDKAVVVSYKPNILLADAGAIAAGLNGGSGQVKMTPWLSTDQQVGDNAFQLSRTVHYGHILFVEADTVNTTTKPPVCRVEVKVVWEFKNPRGVTESSPSLPQSVKKMIQ